MINIGCIDPYPNHGVIPLLRLVLPLYHTHPSLINSDCDELNVVDSSKEATIRNYLIHPTIFYLTLTR